mmetsp:Transcript_25047/g.24008  ORF Transcript_25047/g.24008 Transcript_25047/m.24008 type:complete len:424 (+) Transcript_25047:1-1272(+)
MNLETDVCFVTYNGDLLQSGGGNYFVSYFSGTASPNWYAEHASSLTDGVSAIVLGSFTNTLPVLGKITAFKMLDGIGVMGANFENIIELGEGVDIGIEYYYSYFSEDVGGMGPWNVHGDVLLVHSSSLFFGSTPYPYGLIYGCLLKIIHPPTTYIERTFNNVVPGTSFYVSFWITLRWGNSAFTPPSTFKVYLNSEMVYSGPPTSYVWELMNTTTFITNGTYLTLRFEITKTDSDDRGLGINGIIIHPSATAQLTSQPSSRPTMKTQAPSTEAPTRRPTFKPNAPPTSSPTKLPTSEPSRFPSGTDLCHNNGTYVTSLSPRRCQYCPGGMYSMSGSSSCSLCPAGSFSQMGSSICTPCVSGSISDSFSSACTPCSSGYYAASRSQCSQCAAGSYSDPGSSICLSCPTGQFSGPGASGCVMCSA